MCKRAKKNYCGGKGHLTKDCLKRNGPSCYNSGARGHLSRECSKPRNSNKIIVQVFKEGQEAHFLGLALQEFNGNLKERYKARKLECLYFSRANS